jgi:hypothetical protein
MDLEGIGCKGVEWILQAQHSSVGLLNTTHPSDSIKGGEFLDQLSNYQLLKNSTPWS